MDFIHDGCTDGQRFRCLTLVDECTRECPQIEVGRSVPAARVIGVLDALAMDRGLPERIVVDQGRSSFPERSTSGPIGTG